MRTVIVDDLSAIKSLRATDHVKASDIASILKFSREVGMLEEDQVALEAKLKESSLESVKLANDVLFAVMKCVIESVDKRRNTEVQTYRVEFRAIAWYIHPEKKSIWIEKADGRAHTKLTLDEYAANLDAYRAQHDALPLHYDVEVQATDAEEAEFLAREALEEKFCHGGVNLFMFEFDTDVDLASAPSTDPLERHVGETRTMHDARLEREYHDEDE